MTYYGADQLADAFGTVRKNTLAIAQDIPEDKCSFRAAPETRTVSQLLIHIAVSSAVAAGAAQRAGAIPRRL